MELDVGCKTCETFTTIVNRKERIDGCEKCLNAMVMSQDHWFSKVWKVIILLLSTVSAYLYTFEAAFQTGSSFPLYFEFIFLLDLIKTFFTERQIDLGMPPIRKPILIMKHYLKNGFLLDIVPLIPL